MSASKKKLYTLNVPVWGTRTVEVEAFSLEEAMELAQQEDWRCEEQDLQLDVDFSTQPELISEVECDDESGELVDLGKMLYE